MNTEEQMKPENQVEVGNLAHMTKEELRELPYEEMKRRKVRLCELMGIDKQREEEIDELIHDLTKDPETGGERIDQVLEFIKEKESLTIDEKLYVAYAFGSIQGKMATRTSPMSILHELLG